MEICYYQIWMQININKARRRQEKASASSYRLKVKII